jgi:integrase
MLYLTDLPEDSPTRNTIRYHVKALSAFWGEKSLADVKGSTCREYLKQRTLPPKQLSPHTPPNALTNGVQRTVKTSTARQELKTLQAAINHWHKESALSAVPKVSLPKPGARRERVLERSEVARMLWACRRLSREGHKAAKGAVQYTDYSHVARFILIGLYTGTRHDALIKLQWNPGKSGGHIDLARGVIFRRGSHERETSKRRPPVMVPARINAWVGRWRFVDQEEVQTVIHYRGQRVTKMRRAWNTVREAAGLGPDVTPHTLRHTCVSWHLWDGKTTWEVGQIVGADAATIDRVYGHHKLDGKHRGFVNPKARKE